MGRLLKIGCLGVVALVVVVGAIVAVTVGMSGSGDPSPSGEEYEVVYEVTGSDGATRADMTFTASADLEITQESGEALPWRKRLTFDEEPLTFYSVSAQNRGSGKLTCTVTVNGDEVTTNTATGRFAIVSCDASSE